jgi:thiol-disulfide isomerase/thioredoxin
MKKKNLLTVFYLTSLICQISFGKEAIVFGKIISSQSKTTIKYFPPFKNFSNFAFQKEIQVDSSGVFAIEFNITKPTFVEILFENVPVWLLIEPNDKIEIEINPTLEKKNSVEWLTIKGDNREAHQYFNCFFNFHPIDKYMPIRTALEENLSLDNTELLSICFAEITKTHHWLDSLLKEKSISVEYHAYMKADIEAALAKELCIGVNKFFEDDSIKCTILKQEIFRKIDPLNEKLNTSLYGKNYTLNYYESIFKKTTIDSQKVLIDELAYYFSMPISLQEHSFAETITSFKRLFPEEYNYCELFKKYKQLFKNQEYIDAFNDVEICKKHLVSDQEKIIIRPVNDADFFSTLSQLPNTRLYIDIWATWCLPCKMEFSKYDANFAELLDKYKIQPLYISIDEAEKKPAWEKTIKELNLKGMHIMAGDILKKSLEEDVFENKGISIPRYILVDADGKILLWDAPRPSDPKIREIFDDLLKKK